MDLENHIVTDDTGLRYSFEVDTLRRECLLKGWDEIGLTLRHEAAISAFEKENLMPPETYDAVDVKFHHQ